MGLKVDFARIGRGLTNLWEGITKCQWPESFFRDTLGITSEGLLDAIPTLLLLYFLLYLVLMVSALTLRLVQGQGSSFHWKEKIPLFLVSLVVFPVWPVFLSVGQQMGQIAAGVEGHFSLELSGIYYVFDLLGALWWPLVVFVALGAVLYYPLYKAWKCFISHGDKPLVGFIWTVFDVGLGLFCASCVLLGMRIGRRELYLMAIVAILLNHFGEKKKVDPPKKKTAEIYSA